MRWYKEAGSTYANLQTLILVLYKLHRFYADCRLFARETQAARPLFTVFPLGGRSFVSRDQSFDSAIPVAHDLGCKFRLREAQLLRGVCVVC